MIESYSDLQYYLDQDRRALGIKDNVKIKYRIKEFFFPHPIWKFERLLRKTEYCKNVMMKKGNSASRMFGCLGYMYYKIKFHKLSLKLGFSIPCNAFGPGLSIAHYGSIIVNDNVKVGANCRLHCGVNIGASAGGSNAPEIGDNVYIGPGAIIFGDIKIVSNVTIGANSTVNKSCLQENVVFAGTPAKIVKENTASWTVFNKLV